MMKHPALSSLTTVAGIPSTGLPAAAERMQRQADHEAKLANVVVIPAHVLEEADALAREAREARIQAWRDEQDAIAAAEREAADPAMQAAVAAVEAAEEYERVKAAEFRASKAYFDEKMRAERERRAMFDAERMVWNEANARAADVQRDAGRVAEWIGRDYSDAHGRVRSMYSDVRRIQLGDRAAHIGGFSQCTCSVCVAGRANGFAVVAAEPTSHGEGDAAVLDCHCDYCRAAFTKMGRAYWAGK